MPAFLLACLAYLGVAQAASAVGSAALPAGLGLLLGAAGPRLLAPALLALGLAMGGLYAFIRPA